MESEDDLVAIGIHLIREEPASPLANVFRRVPQQALAIREWNLLRQNVPSSQCVQEGLRPVSSLQEDIEHARAQLRRVPFPCPQKGFEDSGIVQSREGVHCRVLQLLRELGREEF